MRPVRTTDDGVKLVRLVHVIRVPAPASQETVVFLAADRSADAFETHDDNSLVVGSGLLPVAACLAQATLARLLWLRPLWLRLLWLRLR